MPPPEGAVVTELPSTCNSVYANGVQYRDCGGAFYQSTSNGYKVVEPPVGAMVNTLPDGAQKTDVGGQTYFLFGGGYYQPFYSGNSVVYKIVAPPA